MQCSKCHFEAPADFTFCPKCGAQLQRVCPQCGFAVPAEFAFCPRCGRAVDLASPEAIQQQSAVALTEAAQRLIPKEFAERIRATRGRVTSERRMVTMLFCDVRGSTTLAEKLDPEEVMDIMNGAFEFLITPIYRHEGTLARLMGDAILAFFGAPIGHEDDSERAIRAALEITAEAQGYAERLEKERGIKGFNVRVGINTGLVVVGEVGVDLRVEYTAMGDAVNLAARMEQASPPGGILITHDTYRHVRGVFDVQPQQPLAVKGRSQPVQTYLVQRAKARAFRTASRGVEGIETRMVGRDAELLVLQNAYRDAIEDLETRVVTAVGEAGVGKSRLLDEFYDWADLRPELFFYFKGRAAAGTRAVPYSLIRDLFAYRFDILDSDSAAAALDKFRAGMAGVLEPERADLVGQLVGFDFEAANSPAVKALLGSPNFGQLATAYLVQYARGLLEQNPVVILLEDLQWADDSSLDLVAHLVEEMPKARLLVVAAARSALFERRPNWGEGQEAYMRLELKPLSKRASRELVEEILQKVPDPPEALRALVVEGAEGNPYYAEELIKMLIEDGVIVRPTFRDLHDLGGAAPPRTDGAEETWYVELERLAQARVPPTLTGILQARLDSLPQAEKAVLQRAAVVGRLFWDDLVGELTREALQGAQVPPLLEALRQRELVFRRERSAFAGTQEYTFKHSILRDVTYETVLLKLRRKYHAQVAQWLEAHAGERLSEYLGLIATHHELAGNGFRAAEYWQRSGDEAFRVGALRDARAAFERALKLLPAHPSAPLLSLGDASQATPPLPCTGKRSTASLSQAAEQDGAGDEAPERLRATLLAHLGETLFWLGQMDVAIARTQEGLAVAHTVGDRSTQVAALTTLGLLVHGVGRNDEARSHLEQAVALAQDCDDRPGLAAAQRALGRLEWGQGHYDEAVRQAQQSRALYQQLGDRHGVARALNVLGIVAVNRCEYDAAARYLSDGLELGRASGDRVITASVLNNLGEVARKLGDLDRARAYYEQSSGLSEELGMRANVALAHFNMALLDLAQGRDEACVAQLHAYLLLCRKEHYLKRMVPSLGAFAQLRANAGQFEPAAELLGLLFQHPAAHNEDRFEAEPLLARLREALPPDRLEAAMARGAARDLDEVVEELLAESSSSAGPP